MGPLDRTNRFAGIEDPASLLEGLFEHSPVAYQVYRTDGRCLLVNPAFRALFGAEPPAGYNVLEDPQLLEQGLVTLIRRAIEGETVRIPPHWYDPREARPELEDGRRVGLEVTIFPLRDRAQTVRQIALCFRDVTAELERQQERDYLRALEAFSVEITTIHRPDTTAPVVSASVERILGWTPAEFGSKEGGRALIHPDDQRRVDPTEVLANPGVPKHIEYRLKHRDGSWRWMSVTAINLLAHPTIRGIVAHHHDITNQRDTLNALRQSEEELAATLDSIGDAVIATDSTGRVTKLNPIAAKLTGWSIGEARGRPLPEVFRIVQEGTRAPVESPVEQVLREGVIVGLANHTILIAKDGTERAIADSAAPIRGATGAVLGVVLVFRDQSEERAMALELERSAARLRVLAESSRQFATKVKDLHELTEVITRRLGELMGAACSLQLVSSEGPWLDTLALYHPDAELAKAVEKALFANRLGIGEGVSGQVAASGGPLLIPFIPMDELLQRIPARYHWVVERMGSTSFLVLPLKSRGRVVGVLSMMRSDEARPFTNEDQALAEDLANRAALALENSMFVLDLEERVAKRTAAFEEANRELESFSYSVAHDLRAPLRAMSGFSTVLVEDHADKLDPEARKHLDRIATNAERMNRIIDALLSLARLTRTEPRKETVDLTALARSVVDQLRGLEPARNVDFVVDEGMIASGDPDLLRAVLDNLLGNAWKFTSHRPDARIKFGREDSGGGPMIYYVRDNGAGFVSDLVGKLFTPFQRLHKPSEFEGTGVGLATVKRIIARHGGRVWAEGAEGRGATLRFTLAPPGAGRGSRLPPAAIPAG
jgi:PAS domain S-box-containing protein